jgi:hypothetical protein
MTRRKKRKEVQLEVLFGYYVGLSHSSIPNVTRTMDVVRQSNNPVPDLTTRLGIYQYLSSTPVLKPQLIPYDSNFSFQMELISYIVNGHYL